MKLILCGLIRRMLLGSNSKVFGGFDSLADMIRGHLRSELRRSFALKP